MKARTLVRFVFVMGSLCVSAWQMPGIINKMEQSMGRAPGAPGTPGAQSAPGAGPTGIAGLMSGLLGQPQVGGATNPLRPGAPGARENATPIQPMRIEEMTLFSPDGKPLTKEEKERLLREAARLAPTATQHATAPKR